MAKAETAKGIIVLGMHRSGTSCVSSLLNSMGGAFSSEGKDTLANAENPKGFWEHPKLRLACNQLLQSCGNDWWSVQGFSVDSIPTAPLNEARQEFSELVSELAPLGTWFIKEPRLCLVLPAFRDQIAAPVVVHVWRDPVEVAISLGRRNGFALDFGVALWEKYTRCAFQSARGLPSIIVSYNDLLNEPQRESLLLLDELSTLGVSGMQMPNQEILLDVVDSTLHRNVPLCDASDLLSELQLDLLNALKLGDVNAPAFNQPLSMSAAVRLNDAQSHEAAMITLQAQAAVGRKIEVYDRRREGETRRLNAEIKRLESAKQQLDARYSELNKLEASLAEKVKESSLATADALAKFDEAASVANADALAKFDEAASVANADALAKFDEAALTAMDRAGGDFTKRQNEILAVQTEKIKEYVAGRANSIKAHMADQVGKLIVPLRAVEKTLATKKTARLVNRIDTLKIPIIKYLYYRFMQKRSDAKVLVRIMKSGVFDPAWYLEHNPDVAEAKITPLIHYIDFGLAEGRIPCPSFNASHYLSIYDDVESSGIHPFVHYALFGKAEGRKVNSSVLMRSDDTYDLMRSGDTYDPIDGQDLIQRIKKYKSSTAKKRVAVYTAVVGGYDKIMIPETLNPEYDYIYYSDREIKDLPVWQFRPVTYFNDDITRIARYYKLHPHTLLSDYDHVVWVDANILIRADIEYLIDAYRDGQEPLGIFPHYRRNCTFAEAEECINVSKDIADLIETQIEQYNAKGLPKKLGLPETNMVVCNPNDPRAQVVFKTWWKELDNGSRRDQLSIMYSLHSNNVDFTRLVKDPSKIARFDEERFEIFHHQDATSPSHPTTYKIPSFLNDVYNAPSESWWSSKAPHAVTDAELWPMRDITVDIVIPVHNALDDVKECLQSVEKTLLDTHRIILVDDGSDSDTQKYLTDYAAAWPSHVKLIRHNQAKGYTKAANAGMKASTSADYVILLNSDTVVPPLWSLKLVHCAQSAPEIGIVGPLSNAVSWQSVPEIKDKDGSYSLNPLPESMTIEDADSLCQSHSLAIYPRVTLVNGFCFLIKRSVIDMIGYFDEISYPKGYCEENDYCFRASDAGFDLAIATDTYVFHAKSKSYTPKKRLVLCEESRKTFVSTYGLPRITRATESTRKHPLIERLRKEIKGAFENA